jgi:hypothetical protein
MLTQQQIIATALPILLKHGVTRAGLFGSYADGEARVDSDVDLLVAPRSDSSLLDFIGLQLELADALNVSVDLVDYSTIKPLIRDRILAQEVRFHG